jgi:hypothetical protein
VPLTADILALFFVFCHRCIYNRSLVTLFKFLFDCVKGDFRYRPTRTPLSLQP